MSSLPESRAPQRRRSRFAIAGACVVVGLLLWYLWRTNDDAVRFALHPSRKAPSGQTPEQPTPPAPSARANEDTEAESPPPQVDPPAAIQVVGRVLDADRGTPLPGAGIELADVVESPGTHESRLTNQAVTGADGSFVTIAVPSSQYLLRVSREGYASELLCVDVPELSSSIVGDSSQVSAGDVRMYRGMRARFRVVDARSQSPIAGAGLYVFEGSNLGSGEITRFLGTTDESGVRDVAERIALRSEDTTVVALSQDGLGLLPLASGDRLASEREFVVPIVACGDFLFEVRDDQGRPLGGATVYASPHFYPLGPLANDARLLDLSGSGGDGGRLRARFEGRTGDDGRALLRGFPEAGDPDGYGLSAKLDGYRGTVLSNQQVDPGAVVPREFVLVRASPVTRLEGTVRSEDGSPLPLVTVSYGGKLTTANLSSGHYELSGFDLSTIDSLWLRATARGWVCDKVRLPSSASGTFSKDITMFRGGSIQGAVLDDSGHPISRARVHMIPNTDAGRRRALTSAATPALTLTDGRFTFPDLRNGEYLLIAQLEDLRSEEFAGPPPELRFPRVIASAGDSNVQITATRDNSRKGSVHALVVDARTRAPIDIAAVAVVPPKGTLAAAPPRPASFSIRIGEVDVPEVLVGRWGMWVLSTSGAAGFTEFETTDAAPNVSIEVRVRSDTTLAGQLVVADGTPAPKTWAGIPIHAVPTLEWIAPSGWPWLRGHSPVEIKAVANADGSFTLEGVMAGRYLVQASGQGLSGTVTLAVNELESGQLELVLR